MSKLTLADVLQISSTAKIRLECMGCHRVVTLSAQELADKWGPYLRLDIIERRGQCRACGSTHVTCRPDYPPAAGKGSGSGR